MKKLQNKVFYTLLSILTLFVLTIILIFNIQNYYEAKSKIKNTLNEPSMNNKDNMLDDKVDDKKDPKPFDENIKFMDTTMYTILLDHNNNIRDIINHSNNEITSKEISDIAINILENKNLKKEYIGFLYVNRYSYKFTTGNDLIIVDNKLTNNKLTNELILSLIILSISEIIIVIGSKKLTKWITNPVKETFQKQKEFVADASHELKTPLSVITASLDAIENNPKEVKYLKNIKYETERMSDLITDLLDLSTTENKNNLLFEMKDLSKIVLLISLAFEGKAYENNLKISSNIESDINYLINENEIKELVEILLDNACSHAYKESTINIELKQNNSFITLLVQNEGDEIPKGEEEKIFERFYRVDKSRNRKESRYGLGLAIAKNIVANHNGEITASSDNNLTTFKVLFKK